MWDWVEHCFKNYAVFRGRAARPEFWWFSLFTYGAYCGIYGLTLAAPTPGTLLKWSFWGFTVPPLARRDLQALA